MKPPKLLIELFREFVRISNPNECRCEYQHHYGCSTMEWMRKMEELENAVFNASFPSVGDS